MKSEHLQVTLLYPPNKGGQQVGLANPAIRVEHLPTKTVAICEMSQSQIKNKRIATEMIEWALSEMGYSEAE